jgi:hypothetical protein
MAANILKIVQLALFAAFAAAPVCWMLAFGAAAPYEQRAQTEIPGLGSVIAPEGDARDQLSDAIFERSDLRRIAISTKNALEFEVLGFADAEQVVSGAPGWLFYKPEIEAWTCERLADNRKDFEAVVLLGEIAAANGLPFVLAIAPNKASVERNAVQGRARLLLDCYFETADLLEARLAEANLPSILHHTPLVRARGESGDAFFRTDTHWLPVTGFLAAGDLMRSLGLPGFPQDFQPATQSRPRSTDLRRMLLLSPNEVVPFPDMSSEPAKSAIAANRLDGANTLILHDSFYAEISDSLLGMLNNAQMLHIENDRSQTSSAVAGSEQLVVSSVERFLLQRVRSDADLGWLSPVGRWVMDGADAAADQCQWEQTVNLLTSTKVTLHALSIDPGGAARSTSSDPRIQLTAPTFSNAATCLHIELELATPDVLQIFFQASDPADGFIEQRSVRREVGAGLQRVQLVLPASAAGKDIRIDPVSNLGDFRIVSLKAAPAPVELAPVVAKSRPMAAAAAETGPKQVVLAGPGQLNTFLIVPNKSDSGRILPDGTAYEARSSNANRAASGDGDGVLLRMDAATARQFSGRRVKVEVTARASPERGSSKLRMMYSRSGAPESSGWQELSVTKNYATVSFDYTVPLAPPASFDFIGIWSDPTGKGLGIDISSVIVKTIDDSSPL